MTKQNDKHELARTQGMLSTALGILQIHPIMTERKGGKFVMYYTEIRPLVRLRAIVLKARARSKRICGRNWGYGLRVFDNEMGGGNFGIQAFPYLRFPMRDLRIIAQAADAAAARAVPRKRWLRARLIVHDPQGRGAPGDTTVDQSGGRSSRDASCGAATTVGPFEDYTRVTRKQRGAL